MIPVPTRFDDVLEAFEFANMGGIDSAEAILDLRTGETYLRSDYMDENNPLPDDIDNNTERYLVLPDKRDLGLGKPLALLFADTCLDAEDAEKVHEIFSRRGAYARFKDLLEYRDCLEQWYEFESQAQRQALLEWLELEDIQLVAPV